LLRYARDAPLAAVAVPLIFVAHAAGLVVAARGSEVGNVYLFAFGMIVFTLFRALVSALPYAADRLIGPHLDERARMLVFPLAFTTVEWLMALLPAPNSSGSSLYSQYDSAAFTQILSVTGMWGVAFLIGWAASTVNALWECDFDPRPRAGAVLPFFVALIATLVFGGLRLNFAPPSSPTVVAATVTVDSALYQQALRPPFDWLTFGQSSDETRAAVRPQFEATFDQMLARSEAAMRAGAKIVGWQEGSALVLEEDKPLALDRASALAKRYDAVMQMGLNVFTRAATRRFLRNQSILIDASGTILATYDKTYPVISGEAYVEIAGQGKVPIVETPYGRMATAICNDFHFPALIRQAGRGDVDIMMAPYNDLVPWGAQDAVVARFRAVENGYSMVKAAGRGVSMITDYQGRIMAQQDYGAGDGMMIAAVPTRGVVTIYSRIGDALAYLCAAGLAGLAGWAFLRGRAAKN
jgi:apolipoprotein N-acyltransferase